MNLPFLPRSKLLEVPNGGIKKQKLKVDKQGYCKPQGRRQKADRRYAHGSISSEKLGSRAFPRYMTCLYRAV